MSWKIEIIIFSFFHSVVEWPKKITNRIKRVYTSHKHTHTHTPSQSLNLVVWWWWSSPKRSNIAKKKKQIDDDLTWITGRWLMLIITTGNYLEIHRHKHTHKKHTKNSNEATIIGKKNIYRQNTMKKAEKNRHYKPFFSII